MSRLLPFTFASTIPYNIVINITDVRKKTKGESECTVNTILENSWFRNVNYVVKLLKPKYSPI